MLVLARAHKTAITKYSVSRLESLVLVKHALMLRSTFTKLQIYSLSDEIQLDLPLSSTALQFILNPNLDFLE